jgi:Putative  PD-(D/E)XK family member, (DUF4420)
MESGELASVFARLPISTITQGKQISYDALALQNGRSLFLAKIAGDSACLLIATADLPGSYPTPIQLENLSVQHGMAGSVLGHPLPEGQRFSVVTLTNSDAGLLGVFLRFAAFLSEALAETPTSKDVAREIRELVDMLQCLRKPCRRSVQGLWAELLLMAESGAPALWLDAWHNDPLDLHDYCFSEGRIEVKSSSGGFRHHRFSHRQLWPPNGKPLVVASVLMDADSSGDSVFQLAHDIRLHLSPDASVRLDRIMLDVLGGDFARAGEFCFDRSSAKSSLRFYAVEIVPRLPEEMPDEISDVSYSVTFSQLEGSETVDWLP